MFPIFCMFNLCVVFLNIGLYHWMYFQITKLNLLHENAEFSSELPNVWNTRNHDLSKPENGPYNTLISM